MNGCIVGFNSALHFTVKFSSIIFITFQDCGNTLLYFILSHSFISFLTLYLLFFYILSQGCLKFPPTLYSFSMVFHSFSLGTESSAFFKSESNIFSLPTLPHSFSKILIKHKITYAFISKIPILPVPKYSQSPLQYSFVNFFQMITL